ncbi:MAG: beta-lactamase family protein, partial [Flavobacteriales bacterium]|nr:beta-lactamase family protein [Flavobacteriales bacterium]
AIFSVASVSKQFTAMAIMILKEQEKLNYDDKIIKYLPKLPYENITIRHLLTHTSGLVPYHRNFLDEHWDKTKIGDNDYLLSLLEEHNPPLVFEPGESWAYNNTGYCLLATIVERVSGLSFEAFLDKYIFAPLGMTSSRVYTKLSNTTPEDYVRGHVYSILRNKYEDADGTGDNRSYYRGGMVGERGVISTTGDLLKWDRALYTEKLVAKQTLEEAFTS